MARHNIKQVKAYTERVSNKTHTKEQEMEEEHLTNASTSNNRAKKPM